MVDEKPQQHASSRVEPITPDWDVGEEGFLIFLAAS